MSQVRNDFNYYELLGVSRTATLPELHAAYRALAVRFHPDVNPIENAEQLTMLLNLAWETLKDPERRHAYDETLPPPTEAPAEEPPARGAVKLPTCERCGTESPTLSVVDFFYVISFLVLSFRRHISGIMCDPCRSKAAARAAFLTVLLGWWGLPLGPIFSLQALYRVATGGLKDRAANSALKRRNAIAYRQRGDLNEALTCMEGAAYFAQDIDEGLADDLRQLHQQGAKRIPTRRMLPGQLAAGLFTMIAFVGLAVAVALLTPITMRPGPLQRCQELNDSSRFREALPYCDKAVVRSPGLDAHLQRATARIGLGSYTAATADLTAALKYDPTNAAALTLRCRAYDETGKPDLALNDCYAALLTDPGNARAYAWRCLARVRAENLRGAMSDCNKAVELAPDDPTGYANRCWANHVLGKNHAALTDCNRALALSPLDAGGYQHRCFTYLALHDAKAAASDCNEALVLNPGLPYAFWGRGIARSSLDDERGTADLETARALFSKQGDDATAAKVGNVQPKD